MKVILAGFNTDRQFGSETPETLSAAYARLSRDPRPVWDLREEACREVERSRRSNERIIFGYGHGSVSEHAVFNIDIEGVSRLAAEALQSFRLASFTEKSQRYIRLDRDWVEPPELSGDALESFRVAVRTLFSLYSEAVEALLAAGETAETSREDARYLLPLCTSCQMGMTANAREIEHMTRRLRAWGLEEMTSLADSIASVVEPVAPSLFRHTTPAAMDRHAAATASSVRRPPREDVVLLRADDDSAVGAWLASVDGRTDGRDGLALWDAMPDGDRSALFARALSGLGVHEALPRCWELARFEFDLRVSSAAFAQLKRHRMATMLASPPSPGNGLRMPPSFARAGLEPLLDHAAATSEAAHAGLGEPCGTYALINAHLRRVTVSVNARELCHFSRLREDAHAQWDIRGLASRMLSLARDRAPLTMGPSGGKSELGRRG